ncbi:MAG: bifunctional oligoribonuclease/PAP phosphatase NrnA [Bacteroidota bacterium]
MNDFKAIFEAIDAAETIVITSHKSPDGDSVGSSMGLYHFLKKINKKVTVVHPDRAPAYISWVEDYDEVVFFDEHEGHAVAALTNCDLLIGLDYNTPSRVGDEMQAVLLEAKAKKIMIDHHLHPALDFFDFLYSDTSAGSTSELIVKFINENGFADLLDKQIGTPLYLGIMTDTGSFRFPSMKAETHEMIAQLMRAGVVHFDVHEKVFDTNTVERLKLRGFALSEKLEILPSFPVAIISLSEEELERFNYQKGDTEGLVNIALSIEGIQVAAFFAEKEGKVKISFRSKGAYEVNQLSADNFAGGGHKYAAGGICFDALEVAVDRFKSVLSNYFPN